MPNYAMLLAAGLGLRMRPLTEHLPKPLIPVAGRAMLDRALDRLDEAGVKRIVVNAHWLLPKIHEHLIPRPDIWISDEAELLDTGGGVAKALPWLGPRGFFACNADIIWQDGERPALARLAAGWDDERMDALLLLQPVEQAFGYDGAGDFILEEDGRLARRAAATAPLVFTGVQMLHPRLLADVPKGAFSLNVLYDRAIAAGRCFGLVHDGGWYHVGTPSGLAAASAKLAGP